MSLIFKKEDPGNHTPVRLSLIPWKVMGQLILKSISKHMIEDNHEKESAWIHQGQDILDKLDNLLR